MSNATDDLREFFEYIWGDIKALVYLPTLDKDVISQSMYEWPRQKEAVVTHVLRAVAEGKDAFFSPALYSQAPPRKENVLGTNVLWADFDNNIPSKFDKIPEPSLVIQSSLKNKQHMYWKLDEFLTDVKKIEDSNRGIAYTFGADTSGWDATQFLRPPGTVNLGYRKNREPKKVQRLSDYGKPLKLVSFDLPSPKEVVNDRIDLENIPDIQNVIALHKWPHDMWDLFRKSADNVSDRSAGLQRLAYHGAESGFSDEEIYAVLYNTDQRWKKYADRHDQRLRLIDCINRARAKIGYNFDDDSVIDALVASIDKPVEAEKPAIYTFGNFLEEKYEFNWIFEGLLSSQGFGLITGAPGTGKTQLLMQLAADLAIGKDFLCWPIKTAAKRCLLLSLEMAGGALQQFAKTNADAYTSAELAKMDKNLMIAPFGTPIPFNEEAGQQFIDNIMEATHPEVVLVDSLSQVVTGQISDESVAKNLTWFIYKHIRDKYNCSIIFVHHNKKDSGSVFNGQPGLDDIYGNTFLNAGLDFGLMLRKTNEQGKLNLHHVKSRLAKEHEALTLKRTEHLTYTVEDSNAPIEGLARRADGSIALGPDSDRNSNNPFGFGIS